MCSLRQAQQTERKVRLESSRQKKAAARESAAADAKQRGEDMVGGLNSLRDMNALSIALRMLTVFACSFAIGLERELKRRPAGLRTHILICIGAAMTMITGQYLALCMHYYTDMGRIGAQVIAGIGFIGGGAIIVTKSRHIRGLTTAAGLWTTAIIGLAAGAGYFEGAVITAGLVLLVETVFFRFENRIIRRTKDVNFYLECTGGKALKAILADLRTRKIQISNLEVTKHSVSDRGKQYETVISIRLNGEWTAEALSEYLKGMPDVLNAEIL